MSFSVILTALVISGNWVCSDHLYVPGTMTCQTEEDVIVLPPGALVPEGWPTEPRQPYGPHLGQGWCERYPQSNGCKKQ